MDGSSCGASPGAGDPNVRGLVPTGSRADFAGVRTVNSDAAERRLAIVIEQAPVAIHIFAPDGTSLLANDAWNAVWQGAVTDPEGSNVFAHPVLQAAGLVPYMREAAAGRAVTTPPLRFEPARTGDAGEPRWLQGSLAPIVDQAGAVHEVVMIEEDVTARLDHERQLRHRALHDPLTDLPNRALFRDRLGQALARAPRAGAAAVLFLDLDRFKTINDSLGHPAGDRLLRDVARRLPAHVRPGDTVARFGGDEFALLLEGGVTTAAAAATADRVATLREPLVLDGQSVVVAASVGVVLAEAGADPDELLRDADVAMYAAKRAGGGRFRFFEPSMRAAVRERLVLETDLRRALERDELLLHYQPIVDLATNRTIGVEALVRWAHPKRGLLLPGTFVPLAEETGLILPLGRWVLAESCRQLRAWQASGRADQGLRVSVNLSARQFAESALVEEVAETLGATGLAPGCLQLEITESAAMADPSGAIVTLQELKALGVRLALDDFGTGYSSLGQLRRFPLDVLKIDRGFVAGLEDDAKGAAIAGAMVWLGRALGLVTVAEGVESANVLDRVRALGCEVGQGYLFAKPLTAEAAEELLAGAGPAVW